MPGRIRLFCVRCGWVDPLADDDVIAEVPVLCLACQRTMMEDRRMSPDRRQVDRYGPWKVRGERRRGKDRRRER